MNSVIYELRANDISEEDIEIIMSKIKNRLSDKNLDIELQKLGYDKIFTVDYDEYDEENDYDDDDDFQVMRKHKHNDFE